MTNLRVLAAAAGLILFVSAQNPCERRDKGVVCGEAEAAQVKFAHGWQLPHKAPRKWRRPHSCPEETSLGNIEPLWPEMHFRGPLSGPQSWRRRVPKHFLARHANFSRCRRRVYVDVGAKLFETKDGLLGTLQFYPDLLDFDEFYAFEAVAGFYKLPPQKELLQKLTRAGMNPDRATDFSRRHFFFQAFVGARSDPSTSPPTIGLSDFLLRTLQLQPADAVVLKLDVEVRMAGVRPPRCRRLLMRVCGAPHRGMNTKLSTRC